MTQTTIMRSSLEKNHNTNNLLFVLWFYVVQNKPYEKLSYHTERACQLYACHSRLAN